jgi:hypothetical protein
VQWELWKLQLRCLRVLPLDCGRTWGGGQLVQLLCVLVHSHYIAPNAESDEVSDSRTDTIANTIPYTDPNAVAHTTNAIAHSHSDAEPDPVTDARTDAEPDAHTNTRTDARADPRADAEPDAHSNIRTDAVADPRADARADV